MNIQVNTDHNIQGSEELNAYVKGILSDVFTRYKGAITRIEVHLSDENAGKVSEHDKRCLLEARVSHYQPVAVSHHADTIHEAIQTAADKLLRSLDSMIGKSIKRESPKGLGEKKSVVEDEDFEG